MLLDPSRVTSKNSASAGYILLTGATGLLGRYLVRDLLGAGHRLAVLARDSSKLSCHERVEQIIQWSEEQLGRSLPRPVVLRGEVTEKQLGLDRSSRRWVARYCDRLIHNAAILQFSSDPLNDEPWRTNLHGTLETLRFAMDAGIGELHYVSTAYVSGKRGGVILEDQLDMGQSFRNDYEASKYEAELAVRRSSKDFDSVTVYRPGVISGDSQTGYTSTYHGLLVYLRLMAMLVPHQSRDERGVIQTSIAVPLDGDRPRNVVSVDWVSAVISHLFSSPAAHGRTFHLTPENGLTGRKLVEYCYAYFNSEGVVFCGGGDSALDCRVSQADNDFAAKILENIAIYADYDCSDPQYDTTNLRQFAVHLPAPEIDQNVIFRYLEYGQSDRWGKRRIAPPRRAAWNHSILDEIAASAADLWISRGNGSSRMAIERPREFGLDVRGVGGGQWRFFADNRRFHFEPGLPLGESPVVRLDSSEIAQLIETRKNHPNGDLWANVLLQRTPNGPLPVAIKTVA